MFVIIREPDFDHQMILLCKKYGRMKELDQAIDWALCMNPHRIPHTIRFPPDYYLWVTDEFYQIDIPSVRILYRIDVEYASVHLISIKEISDKDRSVLSNI